MNEDGPFMVCPMCSATWNSQNIFMADPTLKIDGYLADFENLDYSLFYFTHVVDNCRSTFTVEARKFLNLYTGTRHTDRQTGTEECPGFCLDQDNLERCDALCECAFNREIIQIIKDRQTS